MLHNNFGKHFVFCNVSNFQTFVCKDYISWLTLIFSKITLLGKKNFESKSFSIFRQFWVSKEFLTNKANCCQNRHITVILSLICSRGHFEFPSFHVFWHFYHFSNLRRYQSFDSVFGHNCNLGGRSHCCCFKRFWIWFRRQILRFNWLEDF